MSWPAGAQDVVILHQPRDCLTTSPSQHPHPVLPSQRKKNPLASWQQTFVDHSPLPAVMAQCIVFGCNVLLAAANFTMSSTEALHSSLPDEHRLLLLTDPDSDCPREEEEELLNLLMSPGEKTSEPAA